MAGSMLFKTIYKLVCVSFDKLIMNSELNRVKRDEESICYGNLGCFRDEGPFDYLDMLPSSPDEIETKFLFYNRANKYTPIVYTYFNYTSIGEGYNVSLPTKVIIHGFGSTCGRAWASEMRLTLLAVVSFNLKSPFSYFIFIFIFFVLFSPSFLLIIIYLSFYILSIIIEIFF